MNRPSIDLSRGCHGWSCTSSANGDEVWDLLPSSIDPEFTPEHGPISVRKTAGRDTWERVSGEQISRGYANATAAMLSVTGGETGRPA